MMRVRYTAFPLLDLPDEPLGIVVAQLHKVAPNDAACSLKLVCKSLRAQLQADLGVTPDKPLPPYVTEDDARAFRIANLPASHTEKTRILQAVAASGSLIAFKVLTERFIKARANDKVVLDETLAADLLKRAFRAGNMDVARWLCGDSIIVHLLAWFPDGDNCADDVYMWTQMMYYAAEAGRGELVQEAWQAICKLTPLSKPVHQIVLEATKKDEDDDEDEEEDKDIRRLFKNRLKARIDVFSYVFSGDHSAAQLYMPEEYLYATETDVELSLRPVDVVLMLHYLTYDIRPRPSFTARVPAKGFPALTPKAIGILYYHLRGIMSNIRMRFVVATVKSGKDTLERTIKFMTDHHVDVCGRWYYIYGLIDDDFCNMPFLRVLFKAALMRQAPDWARYADWALDASCKFLKIDRAKAYWCIYACEVYEVTKDMGRVAWMIANGYDGAYKDVCWAIMRSEEAFLCALFGSIQGIPETVLQTALREVTFYLEDTEDTEDTEQKQAYARAQALLEGWLRSSAKDGSQ